MTGRDLAAVVEEVTGPTAAFAQAMRDEGIHVGMGPMGAAVCVTCEQRWPCETERAQRSST